jgi:hypothetical protein
MLQQASKVSSQAAPLKPYQKPTLSKGPLLAAVTAAVTVSGAPSKPAP